MFSEQVKEKKDGPLEPTNTGDAFQAKQEAMHSQGRRGHREKIPERDSGGGGGGRGGRGGGGRAGGASGGGARDAGAAERERQQELHRRGIRRVASTEDMVPAGRRLTADRLKMLGSGLATEFTLSPPVFSPVKGSGKEPAYSPVARDRAAELDADRPVSLTRKFFRQLSGEL